MISVKNIVNRGETLYIICLSSSIRPSIFNTAKIKIWYSNVKAIDNITTNIHHQILQKRNKIS